MTAATPVRLGAADYVLLHGVSWLVCNIYSGDPSVKMIRAVLAEVLPQVNLGHPLVAEMAEHAEVFARPAASADSLSAARMRAREVVLKFHMGRAGEALDVFRRGSANG